MKFFQFTFTIMAFILFCNLDAKSQIEDNCDVFTAELKEIDLSASSVDTAPRLQEKSEEKDHFLLNIEKHGGDKITLKLLKSKMGRELFEYISVKDILIKEHGSTQVRIYKIGSAGGLIGKNFDRLCF